MGSLKGASANNFVTIITISAVTPVTFFCAMSANINLMLTSGDEDVHLWLRFDGTHR